jgi:hypothetical protein
MLAVETAQRPDRARRPAPASRSGRPIPWSVVALTALTAISVIAGSRDTARPISPAPLIIVTTAP